MARKAGRMTLFTEDTRSALLAALSAGATVEDACRVAGVGLSTYYMWQDIGDACLEGRPHDRMPRRLEDRAVYAEFAEAIKKAQATARFRAVTTIQASGRDRWVHRQTGQVRATPPPPVTWMHKATGKLVFEDPVFLSDPIEWEKQWSGEAWVCEKGDWRALAWYLERSDYNHWGRKTGVELGWRKEAEQAGLNAGELFEQLVQHLAEQMGVGEE